MKMTEGERLAFLIDKLERGTARRFSEKTGIPCSRLTQIKKGQLHLAPYIDRIIRAYPDINLLWLVTGDGTPANDERQQDVFALLKKIRKPGGGGKLEDAKDRLIASMLETIEWQGRLINELMKNTKQTE